jgi:hypothetical protein
MLKTCEEKHACHFGKCLLLLSDFNQNWNLSKICSIGRQYQTSRKSVQWFSSFDM